MTNEALPVEPDGCVPVPTRPGLGVTLSEAALKKYTRTVQVAAL